MRIILLSLISLFVMAENACAMDEANPNIENYAPTYRPLPPQEVQPPEKPTVIPVTHQRPQPEPYDNWRGVRNGFKDLGLMLGLYLGHEMMPSFLRESYAGPLISTVAVIGCTVLCCRRMIDLAKDSAHLGRQLGTVLSHN